VPVCLPVLLHSVAPWRITVIRPGAPGTGLTLGDGKASHAIWQVGGAGRLE